MSHISRSAKRAIVGAGLFATLVLALLPASASAKGIHLFNSSFGSSGAGAGEFSLHGFQFPGTASGLAVDQQTGDVYVADSGNHRIDEFSADGAFIHAFGWGVENGASELQTCDQSSGCQAGLPGSGPGQLKEPTYIAVDSACAEHSPPLTGSTSPTCEEFDPSNGDLYVADQANASVTKFGPEGELISSWASGGSFHETGVRATGEGEVFPPAEGTGDIKAGSTTIENVVTSAGNFAVGQGIDGEGLGGGHIVAIGTGTITISGPAQSTVVGDHLRGNTNFVTSLSTESGAFERGQDIFGAGTPVGTEIVAAEPEFLALNRPAVPGAGISITSRFVVHRLAGLAVDPAGDLRLASQNESGRSVMFEFSPAGNLTSVTSPRQGGGKGLALAPNGDYYGVGGTGVDKMSPQGDPIGSVEQYDGQGGFVAGFAVDPVSGDLYIVNAPKGTSHHEGIEVHHYPPTCEPVPAGECIPADVFGSEEEENASGRLRDGEGIAVSDFAGHEGYVYIADVGAGKIIVYKTAIAPDVTTEAASNVTQEAATLKGEVDPLGVEVSECVFEYGEVPFGQTLASAPYDHTVPCQTEGGGLVGSGTSPVQVHADLTGLAPAFYHYRLQAKNHNGRNRGGVLTIGASIDASAPTSVLYTSASLGGQINPHEPDQQGPSATCELAYISNAAYLADGESFGAGSEAVPCSPESLGGGTNDVAVTASLSGLSEGAGYRYRFVATLGGHTTNGPTQSIHTYANPQTVTGCANASLPDCRAYELVSTAGAAGEPYTPETSVSPEATALIPTSLFTEAAADGEAVAYAGEPPLTGGIGATGPEFGDQWLARRSPEGWQTQSITPDDGFAFSESTGLPFAAFSPDLTSAFVLGGSHPLTADVPAGCTALYSWSASGEYRSVFSPAEAPKGEGCGSPLFAGASADESQVIFQSEAALTPDAKKATEVPPGYGTSHRSASWPNSAGDSCMYGCNLYLASEGHLKLVNKLGSKAVPNANFGGIQTGALTEGGLLDFSNAISADGQHVFWTDTKPGKEFGRVYAYESSSEESVQVSGNGPAQYWTATPDGHYAYYTEAGGLWRFDTQANSREQMSAAGLSVIGVIGTNQAGEDGAFLYFVAETAEHPKEPKLYVIHEATTREIATLSPGDNSIRNVGGGAGVGDWNPDPGLRTASPSPDGTHMVFESELPLTGYDNTTPEHRHAEEAFTYSFDEDKLSCLSCDPSGLAPTTNESSSTERNLLPTDLQSLTYVHRWMSDNGNRVFFDSQRSLAPADPGGKQSVYEWERAGEGSCTEAKASSVNEGCVFLLSGGGHNYSYLVDADADGSNVFIEHVGPLGAARVQGSENELYDARVDGIEEAPLVPPCESGEACHGALPPPPSGSTPATGAFGHEPGPQPKPFKCKKGFKKATKKGHASCVKVKKHRHHGRQNNHNRGGSK